MENKEKSEMELLRDEIDSIKGMNCFLREDLTTLRTLLAGSIKSTIKALTALRDGIILTQDRLDDIESKGDL